MLIKKEKAPASEDARATVALIKGTPHNKLQFLALFAVYLFPARQRVRASAKVQEIA